MGTKQRVCDRFKGTSLAIFREDAGLTQSKLASLVGCSLSMIKKVESLQCKPSQPMAQAIARVLGRTLPDFYEDAADRQATLRALEIACVCGRDCKVEATIDRGLARFTEALPVIRAAFGWSVRAADKGDVEAARISAEIVSEAARCLQLRVGPAEQIEWGNKALRGATQVGHRVVMRSVSNFLGHAYHDAGRYADAEHAWSESRRLARETRDEVEVGHAELQYGRVLIELNRLPEAKRHLGEALDIARQNGDRRWEKIATGLIGRVFHGEGAYTKAVDKRLEDLESGEHFGDLVGQINTLAGLAETYRAAGESEKGIDSERMRLDLAKRLGDGRNVVLSRKALASGLREHAAE